MKATAKILLGASRFLTFLLLLAAQPGLAQDTTAPNQKAQPANVELFADRSIIVSQFTVPGTNPRGLAWDGSHLWLVDTSRNVYQLDTLGNVISTFSIAFGPSGMTWDGTALWIGDDTNHRQVKFDTNGSILGVLNVWYWPDSGIAWDGTNFWIGNYNSSDIHKHDSAGTELLYWSVPSSSGIEHPTGLVFDGTNLWIGESNEGWENVVARFNTAGHVLNTFDTWDWDIPPVSWPGFKTLAWDGDYLWYSADDLSTVYRLDVKPLIATVPLGEAVDNASLTWTTGGSPGWFGQMLDYYYGGDAARSGAVDSGQSSWIETTVMGTGILSFYWKVSSLGELEFYIDGVRREWCYTDEWELTTVGIPSGSHILRWVYTPLIQQHGEAGFLDRVVFTPGPVILVQAPNGGETMYRKDFCAIRWISTEDVGPNVKLELYKGESPRHTISASTENSGYYQWLIPVQLEAGTDYRVRATSVSNDSIYDYSDGYFTIAEESLPSLRGFLVLDGIDDYAAAADHAELDVGDEEGESLTVEAWVNFQTFGDAQIVTKSAYRLYTKTMFQYPYSYRCLAGEVQLQGEIIHSVELCHTSYSAKGFWIRGWHHVALVFDRASGQLSLYLDGERESTASISGLLKDSGDPLKAGVTLKGLVDEVRVSHISRYTGAAYAVPTLPFTCDAYTRGLWHFDELEGATVFHDVCGADNFLIGYNGAHTEGAPVHKVYLPLILK